MRVVVAEHHILGLSGVTPTPPFLQCGRSRPSVQVCDAEISHIPVKCNLQISFSLCSPRVNGEEDCRP